MKSEQVKQPTCPHCEMKIAKGFPVAGPHRVPQAGDYAFCGECGGLMKVGANGIEMQALSKDELNALSPQMRKILTTGAQAMMGFKGRS